MLEAHINNLIFDLGGVIIDINPAASFEAMQAMANDSALGSVSEHHEVFLQYEKGLIDDERFRYGVRTIIQQPDTPLHHIDEAWCRMLIEVPLPRLQLLLRLKERYRTFVLSNTNQIHVEAFNKMIEAVSGQKNINHYFEKVYYSHELNMRKPDAEIYQHVLEDSNLLPHETLFLDDREENLKAAAALGIATRQVTPDYSIIDIFA